MYFGVNLRDNVIRIFLLVIVSEEVGVVVLGYLVGVGVGFIFG